MSYKVAIIAALEREVAPLVKGWRVVDDGVSRVYRSYAKGETVVICAGIGPNAARRVAEAAVAEYRPELLVSAGLAGSLISDLAVGEAVVPSTIINSATGTHYATGHGSGVLVSASEIAGPEAKRLFARQHSAQLIDMEAAAVVEIARQHGIAFTAVKAISDEADFEVPELAPFVDHDGRFLTGKFIQHIALRPGMWGTVRKLAANSAQASVELCKVLRKLIEEGKQQAEASSPASIAHGKDFRTR
jgi:adenosylhomocysteine nucleosidase